LTWIIENRLVAAHVFRPLYHWAENTAANASVVFAVFSPAFDGKDKREAD